MKLLTDINLMLINFAIIFYFLLIYVLYVFKVEDVIIGVFREMLTIPFLIAEVAFVVVGVNYLQKKTKPLPVISLGALVICAIVTIGSFFIEN